MLTTSLAHHLARRRGPSPPARPPRPIGPRPDHGRGQQVEPADHRQDDHRSRSPPAIPRAAGRVRPPTCTSSGSSTRASRLIPGRAQAHRLQDQVVDAALAAARCPRRSVASSPKSSTSPLLSARCPADDLQDDRRAVDRRLDPCAHRDVRRSRRAWPATAWLGAVEHLPARQNGSGRPRCHGPAMKVPLSPGSTVARNWAVTTRSTWSSWPIRSASACSPGPLADRDRRGGPESMPGAAGRTRRWSTSRSARSSS